MFNGINFKLTDVHEVDPVLLCDLCTNPFNNPRALPCSCVFCYDCIVPSHPGKKHIVCPLCKRKCSLKNLTEINRPLQKILDRLHVHCAACGAVKIDRATFDEHRNGKCKDPSAIAAKRDAAHSLSERDRTAATGPRSVLSAPSFLKRQEPVELAAVDDSNPLSQIKVFEPQKSTGLDNEKNGSAVDHPRETGKPVFHAGSKPTRGKSSPVMS